MTELHVVYGSGPVGTSVIIELLSQGKRVRVVTRGSVPAHLPAGIEPMAGDATDPADARRVCAGASHVYNCTNPLHYERWPAEFPPLQRGVLEGAAANGARLIVMENLYMYGPHDGVPMTEDLPMRGNGSRSTTRKRMTTDLFEAHRAGKVRAASVRASDLFGPHVRESLAGSRLVEPLLQGKAARVFANPDLPHSFSYVPDVGRALVTVGQHDSAFGRAWHAPVAPAITLRELAERIGAEAGVPARLSATPRLITSLLLPIIALSEKSLRGLNENLYINYEPYILDSGRFTDTFGPAATPLDDAIRSTVAWYRSVMQPAVHPAMQEA